MSRSRVPQVPSMSNQPGSKSLHQSTATTTSHPTTPTPKDRKSRNTRGPGVGAYGSLGRGAAGRVPLHRRGTSSKYESLEDLLKEAGYKETRIFTPESDRNTKARGAGNPYDSDGALQHGRALKSSLRGGVGAFVGFFTGLVASKVEDNAGASGHVAGPEYTTPASPSPSPYPSRPAQHRQSSASSISVNRNQHQHQLARNSSSTQLSSSMESLPHWNPQSEQSGVSSRNSAYARHGQRSSPYVYGPGYVQASTSSLRLQVETIPESPSNPSSSHSHRNSYARQSARPHNRPANLRVPHPLGGAGALLRHIASESSLLPERPQSTPPSSASRLTFLQHEDDFQSNRTSVLARNEAKHSWLQSVARTMLLGVPPSSDTPHATSTKDSPGGEGFSPSSINPDLSRRPGLSRTVSNQSYRRPPPTINLSNQHSPISERPPANWGSTSDLLPSRNTLVKRTLHRSASTQSGRLGTPPASNLLAPPSLSRLGLQRSAQSEGEVSRARVVVRSAPGSRANSRVRQAGSTRGQSKNKGGSAMPNDDYDELTPEDMFKKLMAERQKELRLARRGRPKGKGKRVDDLDLPVLAKTKVEGDIWGMRRHNDAEAKREGKGADEKGAKTLPTKHDGPNVRDRRDSEVTIMERRGRDKTRENRYISGWGMQLPSPSPSPQRTHSPLTLHSPASSLSHSVSIRESSSSSSARRHTHDSASSGLAEDEDDSSNGDTSDSSEDGAEIDLARILVPAKRQSSIRSLRRHLATQPRMAAPPLPIHGPFSRDDGRERSSRTPLMRRHVGLSSRSEEYASRDAGSPSS
ncbi:hypothetical protein PTI98_007621 [Pleurotus ostreatus]|nr:hypothetical protein PTI98_007621 [Pleurotus ostreatus]